MKTDPIKFEVIRNALGETTEEMSAALRRSAYSTNIKTRCDFSCAVFDREANVLAQAFAQANHLGSMVRLVPLALEEYGVDNLAPGDAIVMNDPYRGGVHLNDIFLIARAQTGFADMRGQTLDLIEEVSAAVEQMRAIASERGSELRMEAADGEAFVEGDRQRLRQLTQILLRNAFEHGKDGVSVVVSVDRIDSEWELAVADDGPGFAAEDLERVFERFYRGAKSARSGSAVGTGLGLPIARSIVLGHGGRIWIDRSAANGAVVRARFPAAGPVPRHAAASPDLGKRA